MLLGLAALPSTAEAEDFLEINLLKYGVDSYGIAYSAGKDGATSCKLATPSDPSGSECFDGVIRWNLDWAGLQAEIGTPGDDWILTWDEGLPSETIANIDFTTISVSDWLTLPAITNPADGEHDVSPDAVIEWAWPTSPDLGGVEAGLFVGDLEELVPGPISAACATPDSFPPDQTVWDPPCLGIGTWTAMVFNEDEYLRAVPHGIVIEKGEWDLENDEWLASDSIGISTFTVGAVCGNDVVETGEECDDGNTNPGDCCSPTCQYESAGTVCRASAGDCDIPETCTGSSEGCPADAYEPATTECRVSAGVCDIAETCTGTGADCPADAFEPATTECREAAGVCDAPDYCDGASAPCTADAKLTSECRAATGICDVSEVCDGMADDCPIDWVLDGVPCPDGDLCNGDETCHTGTCEAGTPLDCNDQDICTTDSCNAGSGCVFTALLDSDGDDACDAIDNCLYVANPDQANTDSLPAGDACQCGDVDDDGQVTAADVTIAREHLVGATLSGPFVAERCNVTGPSDGGVSDCDVADIFVLQRVIAGEPVAVENTCQAYGGP
jgi:cysteine-rich repeat protein